MVQQWEYMLGLMLSQIIDNMPRDYPSSRPRGYSSVSRSRSRSMSSQPSHHRSRGKYRNNSPYQRSFRNDFDKDDGVRVHVSDLSVDCSKRELEEAFGKFGGYKEVWVARNPPCFAFIVYNHRQDAEEAIRKMDNTYISGSRIRVSFARPRTRGTRRGTVFDPNMRCYTCGERGHFSRECPKMNRGYKSPYRSSHRGGRSKRSRSGSKSPSRSPASSQTYSDRSTPDRRKRASKNHRTSRGGRGEEGKESSRSSRHHNHHHKPSENRGDDRNGRKRGRLSKSSSEEAKGQSSPTVKAGGGGEVDASLHEEKGEIMDEIKDEVARDSPDNVEEGTGAETVGQNADFKGGNHDLEPKEGGERVDEKVENLYEDEAINEDTNREIVVTKTESYSSISKEVSVNNEHHNSSSSNSPNDNNENIFEEIRREEEISISIKQDEHETLDD